MDKSTGKKLKRKGEKNFFVTLVKTFVVIILFLLQFALFILLYTTARSIYIYARLIYEIAKVLTILYVIYHHDSAAYKISWVLFIAFIPIVGILAYILWGNSRLRQKIERQIRRVRVTTENYLVDSSDIVDEIQKEDTYKANQIKYMNKISGFPIYKNYGIEYFKIGEEFFNSLKKDLEKAQKYILINFFIIERGKLFDSIFEILKRKAKEGVKIQIIVDSVGIAFKNVKGLENEFKEYGIEYYKFNPFSPIINGYINYRDHKKIVVIDGIYSYTGGVNIADEYVNLIEKFGHWKDVGIKIVGKCTWSLSVIFLRNLEQITKKNIDYVWYKSISDEYNLKLKKQNNTGYLLALSDGPDNRKNPIENTYIQIINYAKKYIYMTTPYFVISEQLLTAMLNSARSGVDVRVIVPHIPDKKIVYTATRSYYEVLLEAGIKVYEYKPGFIHSKTFVADDNTAIVGTANLDFRSMHLNYENIVWSYKTGVEEELKLDFNEMLNECIEIKLEDWKARSFVKKIGEALISAFSPML